MQRERARELWPLRTKEDYSFSSESEEVLVAGERIGFETHFSRKGCDTAEVNRLKRNGNPDTLLWRFKLCRSVKFSGSCCSWL